MIIKGPSIIEFKIVETTHWSSRENSYDWFVAFDDETIVRCSHPRISLMKSLEDCRKFLKVFGIKYDYKTMKTFLYTEGREVFIDLMRYEE